MKIFVPNKFIPYGRQTISSKDVQAVAKALRSEYLTTGPRVRQFEEKLAAYCGARYAVVCSSGTAALHLSCLALGLKEKDSIVTSPITFLATANCARYVGAEVAFTDIDERTANLDPGKLSQTLRRTRNVKAIFPVHFAGNPAEMEGIFHVARKKGLKIVEDACHALGASYRTRNGQTIKVGSCYHSDMTVFSFHPIKTITTGEGGAITTNDERFYQRLLLFRNHGMEKKGNADPWAYEMNEVGFNYRLTDIQCALGVSQLKEVTRFVAHRRETASFYDKEFKDAKFFRTPFTDKRTRSSYHLYPLRVDFRALKKTRRDVMRELASRGIGTQVHYIPLTRQPYYRKRYGLKPRDYPCAEKYYEQTLSIPIYPFLSPPDRHRITTQVKKVCA